MVRKGLSFLLALCVLLALSVTSVFANGSKESSSSGSSKAPMSVAITLGDVGNPYFYALAKGAEYQAKKDFGANTKVIIDSSAYDLGKQSSQIDNYIASGVKLLILGAADSNGIGPAVARAKKAGMTVIGVDVTAKNADLNITSNNVQAGEEAGKALVKKLDGKGNIVIINGPPVSAVTDRVKGFLSVVKNYPGIKILSQDQNAGGSRDGGLKVMSNLLTAYPDINAVFGINDPTSIGANLAATQAHRSDFFIVSVDGSPDVIKQLSEKNNLILGTAAQDPVTMGMKAVDLGQKIMGGTQKADGSTILIPVKWIDKQNMATYKGWTPPKQ